MCARISSRPIRRYALSWRPIQSLLNDRGHAVYLSALQTIKLEFGGRHVNSLSRQFQTHITNFWPIVRAFRQTITHRKCVVERSFITRFFGARDFIADRLWSSPDDDEQLTVALR